MIFDNLSYLKQIASTPKKINIVIKNFLPEKMVCDSLLP